MKKSYFLLIPLLAAGTIAGCSHKELPPLPLSGSMNEAEASPTPEPEVEADIPDMVTPPKDIYAAEEKGTAKGSLTDVMHTHFFDYTINSAYRCDKFDTYVPEDGYELLVAEVTVTNTTEQSFSMYDNDFELQWEMEDAGEGKPDHSYSLVELAKTNGEVLPVEYILNPGQSRTGLLIYEIPEKLEDFSISYLEYYSDDSTGAQFFVDFTAGQQ